MLHSALDKKWHYKRPLSRRLNVRLTSVTWNVLYTLKTQTTAPDRWYSQLSAPNKHVSQVDLQLRSTGQREEHGSTARLTSLDLHRRRNGVSYHLDSTKNARNCLVGAGNKPKTIRHFEWPGKTRMQKITQPQTSGYSRHDTYVTRRDGSYGHGTRQVVPNTAMSR